MRTILISGLGLIGSSFARMIRKSTPTAIILGTDPDEKNRQFMLDNQLIDECVFFEAGAVQADIIVLAAPVAVIMEQLAKLATLTLKPGVLVTDVGSTKTGIMKAAKSLTTHGVAFVGGHPMAGSHQSGSAAGNVALFQHASYFLVPGNASDTQVAAFQALLTPANFKWVTVTSDQHDQLVSATSHLPHVIASTLMKVTEDKLGAAPSWREGVAGGFRDSTRIAASDPTMWTAILTNNKAAILEGIDAFEQELAELKTAIKNGDQEKIQDFLAAAKQARQSLDQS